MEKGIVKFRGVLVFIGDADFQTVIVKIYEAAPEMPDTVLIGRLSHYGRVLSFRRDRGIATGIFNGVRTARMRLSKIIPSAIRIAGESVFISYPGQPKTCRKCSDVGHLAQGCKNPHWYNCESPGHRSSECEKEPLCGNCLKPDHPVADCPNRLFSANVANAEDQFVSYANMTKQNRPATTADAGSCLSKEPSQPSSQNKSQSTSQATSQDDSQNKSKKGSRPEEPSDKSDKWEKKILFSRCFRGN